MPTKTELTRLIIDESGNVYISIDDLVRHLNETKPQQQEKVTEETTIWRMIQMLEMTKKGYLEQMEDKGK